jgi:S1-C subfamily serine protease
MMNLAVLGLLAAAVTPAIPEPLVPEAVVLVQVYRSRYDWSLPWRQEGVEGSLGSGFLIAGGRVVTNAHVVSDAREVLVRRPDQANPYVATVEAVGNDCDLAVLRISDPAFMKGLKPLALGDVPRSGSRVQTYGFPLGGQDVSSTAGIVSRVESRGYVHSGIDAHLVVQTDAAINPGNSGGPVVQEGRVVGVAFQGYPGFDNMGFFIPVPVVHHFLADLEDGKYDGFPDSGLQTTPLLSPAYRRERGLPEGRAGVVETSSRPAGPRTASSSPGT